MTSEGPRDKNRVLGASGATPAASLPLAGRDSGWGSSRTVAPDSAPPPPLTPPRKGEESGWRRGWSGYRFARSNRPRSLAWLGTVFLYAVGILGTGIALFPIVWAGLSSFTPSNRVGGELDIAHWTLANYEEVLSQHDFWTSLWHSTAVSLGTTAVAIFLGILAAYGLTRFRVRFRRLAFAILAIRMVPGIVLVLPFYLLYRNVGMLDTLHGLGLTYLTFALPFAIWMISGFFESIPIEVEEAAALDGASNWTILWRIVVPLAAPAIMTTAVLTFIFCWNEFLFALILTSQDALTFLPLLLRYVLPQGPLYGQIFAGATIFLVPPLVGLVLIRRHLSAAFGLGAVK